MSRAERTRARRLAAGKPLPGTMGRRLATVLEWSRAHPSADFGDLLTVARSELRGLGWDPRDVDRAVDAFAALVAICAPFDDGALDGAGVAACDLGSLEDGAL